jgi:hypothetical protein
MGTVTAAGTGAPLAATLALLPTTQNTTADAGSGEYALWWVAGTYSLQVSAADYLTKTATVEIVAQSATTQDFALIPKDGLRIYLPLILQ